MQYRGGQERYRKEEQQRPVKIALRLIRRRGRKAPLPAGTPSQRDRQYDGETRAQGVSRPDEVECPRTPKQRNAVECQVQSSKVKKRQYSALPSLSPKQTAGVRVFHVQVQQQRGGHRQSRRDDRDGKAFDPRGWLGVIDLRVEGEQRAAKKQEERQAEKKEH